MNATEQIARFIVDIRYEDSPAAVLNATRTIILDGIANVIAGSIQPELDYVRGNVDRVGGRTIIASAGKKAHTM